MAWHAGPNQCASDNCQFHFTWQWWSQGHMHLVSAVFRTEHVFQPVSQPILQSVYLHCDVWFSWPTECWRRWGKACLLFFLLIGQASPAQVHFTAGSLEQEEAHDQNLPPSEGPAVKLGHCKLNWKANDAELGSWENCQINHQKCLF